MRRLLGEIQDGTFATAWIAENERGRPHFECDRLRDADHTIEQVGRRLRHMMPFVNAREVRPGQGGA